MAHKKTILITGCSSGIGYDAAHELHKRGWQVFATCRQQSDCDRLVAEGLNSFQLDYANEDSIKKAVARTLSETGGKLDALFNNGAYGLTANVEDLPRDALRAIFETNLFGYIDLTNQFIPAMRAQGHGRIINCSSVLGFAGLATRGAYNTTKFALEGITDTQRLEVARDNIKMILIEPGPIETKFRVNVIPHFEKWIDYKNSPHRSFYEEKVIPRLYKTDGEADKFELPASAVTAKLIHALESKRPKPRYYVTTPTYILGYAKRILSTRMFDLLLTKIG